jgi:16S rRNA (guanine966-N2)-methyltransferase
VRIIAGQFRGRTLEAPRGSATRPTGDRVREALFSMLASRIGSFEGLCVVDLYAGSGALGLEALSRGASFATFIEADASAQAAIKTNAAKLGVAERVRILGGPALALPRSEPFDLIFADPPYTPGSGSRIVKVVSDSDWLAAGGWMSVETDRRDPVEPGSYEIEVEREIGRARITLLRRP